MGGHRLDIPAPKEGLAGFWYLLHTHFGKLVTINLLTLLFLLPLVTLPAAMCGACRVLVLLIRTGNVFVWSEFWQEFRRSFWKGLFGGVIFAAGLLVCYYLLSMGTWYFSSLIGMVCIAVGLLLLVFFALLANYTVILMTLQELPFSALLGNAFRMILHPRGRAGWVLALHICMVLYSICLFPLSLLPIPVIGISLPLYCTCWLVYSGAKDLVLLETE